MLTSSPFPTFLPFLPFLPCGRYSPDNRITHFRIRHFFSSTSFYFGIGIAVEVEVEVKARDRVRVDICIRSGRSLLLTTPKVLKKYISQTLLSNADILTYLRGTPNRAVMPF